MVIAAMNIELNLPRNSNRILAVKIIAMMIFERTLFTDSESFQIYRILSEFQSLQEEFYFKLSTALKLRQLRQQRWRQFFVTDKLIALIP